MALPIATERLIVRRFTHDDVRDVLAFVSCPSVAMATPEIVATVSGVREYIDLQNSYQPFEHGKCFDLAIERREDGKAIGLISLVRREHKQGEVGFALGVEYRGQGYAAEAARALIQCGFASLGLHRIHACTDSSNAQSWRVMESRGMRREGVLKEATTRGNRWLDVIIYAILANEYDNCNPNREIPC